jgi:hypothetical protein
MGIGNIAVLPANLQSNSCSKYFPQRFFNWQTAESAGYRTKNQWQKEDRGVRGAATGMIFWKEKDIMLYHVTQTTRLTPRTMAANRLLDRFVPRTDIFGFQPHRTEDWPQLTNTCWNLKELVRKSWNHVVCHEKGVRLTADHRRGLGIMAQAFSVRCGRMSDFFVIDLDNHSPNSANIPVHLDLVALVQSELPRLIQSLGGGSMFYQYRQIEPTGIQCWVTLNWRIRIDDIGDKLGLHYRVRKFLVGLEKKSPGLNQRLRDARLPTLETIEIRPTTSQQVSVPGCYGKSLFTTKELKLVKGRVDVESLDQHIRGGVTSGDVLPRYRALVEYFWGNDFRSCGAKVSLTESSDILPLPPSSSASEIGDWHETADLIIPLDPSSKEGRRYWTDLTRKALNGVTSPDDLYGEYLQPLAQCLLFRDFVRCSDREKLVEEELFSWVTAKHNGFVSRILAGKEEEVRSQCRQVAKRVKAKTCKAVKQYYQSILANDLIFPHRIEHLFDHMRAKKGSGESVEWNAVSLIHCKCSISPPGDALEPTDPQQRPFDDRPLPATISQKVMEAAQNVRQGTVRGRFLLFATRLLNEIASGDQGERNISWRRINAMMEKPDLQARQTQVRYKEKLVQAGLIRSNWQRYIRRSARSSKYRLTEWAYEQFRERDAVVQARSA